MSLFGGDDLSALQDLLQHDDDVLAPSQSIVAAVGPRSSAPTKAVAVDDQAIWADDEIPPEEALGFCDAVDDHRRRAKFDMIYKQHVSSEDVYLGTEKTPSSCHSSDIVYRIAFPDHKHAELDVDVTKTTLRAESSRLRLALYLPQPVDADRGKAQWDANKCVLTISLPVLAEEW
ncbi:hypothetical protein M885DRAFT_509421 [Pelagophyceae sp. CCMP2097]|nr:hypothetical protein M885DRAFT_509421 [Pelagophyceae sp. CCMP2097]